MFDPTSVNVYWACIEPEWVRAEAPVPIFKDTAKDSPLVRTGINKCPAFQKELKNVYGLKSLYSYEFSINDNNEITTTQYDQKFFDRHVLIRSVPEKVFSFSQEFIFFTDEKSLEMTGCILPYLEDNNITERCIVYPGKFNIGKWYRPLEFGFKLKQNYFSFKIDTDEIYQYVKFHTNKKINFIQFRETKKLNELMMDNIRSRSNKKNVLSLEYYYSKFNMKKMIMKEIKENIL